MKKLYLLLPTLLLASLAAFAQEENKISLDLLRSPNSPAFTILGIEPTSIEKPETPTDLMLSLRNASENFTAFPKSYSLEFAPGWVFGGKEAKYEDFKRSDSILQNLWQNSIVSFAINNVEGEDGEITTQLGLGVKLSILRGEIKDKVLDSIQSKFQKLSELLKFYEDEKAKFLAHNEEYSKLKKKSDSLQDIIKNTGLKVNKLKHQDSTLIKKLVATNSSRIKDWRIILKKIDSIENIDVGGFLETDPSLFQQKMSELKEAAKKIKFDRTGFKLDLALGTSWNFADESISNAKLFRYGGWLTGSYDDIFKNPKKLKLSVLATSRLLLSPDEDYEANQMMLQDDNLRLDLGARFHLDVLKTKMSLSIEALYRTVLNNELIDDTHKLAFNFEYEVSKNNLLTLSFGRDFDGNFSSDGNLIAFLNLVVGIGSKRPF